MQRNFEAAPPEGLDPMPVVGILECLTPDVSRPVWSEWPHSLRRQEPKVVENVVHGRCVGDGCPIRVINDGEGKLAPIGPVDPVASQRHVGQVTEECTEPVSVYECWTTRE